MHFLQIEGWAAAGKAVLWSLLDGHKDIFVNPIHDYSHCAIFYGDLNINSLRENLLKTQYYKIERLSKIGYDPIDFGNNATLESKFDFDFYNFDKAISSSIGLNNSLQGKDFLDVYTKKFIENYKTKKYDHRDIKYFASMGNYYEYQKYITSDFFKYTKTIFIQRSVEGIFTGRLKRKPRSIDNVLSKQFAPGWSDLMGVGDVESILHYDCTVLRLKVLFPSNVMVIDFDEIVLNPEKVMKSVSQFLEIPFIGILTTPTRDGLYLEKDGISFTGNINDNPELFLTPIMKVSIKLHKLLFMIHGLPINFLHIKSIVRYLYQRIKGIKYFKGL